MDNPWKHIPFSDYERHMSQPSVGQLSVLNRIFQEQYTSYHPSSLALFGVCTGNGLEHIDSNITKYVVGIDVNGEYLKECASRHSTHGFELQLLEANINHATVTLPPSDLYVANLFLEYVDIHKFLAVIKEYAFEDAVVSTVIQINNDQSFVSKTNISSLKLLDGYHIEIKKEELIDSMQRNQLDLIFSKKYPLPSTKEFLRLDFRMK